MKIFSQKAFKRESAEEVAPAEYLEVMFANIENGKLAIAREEDELHSDLAEDEGATTRVYTYSIDMSKADAATITKTVSSLIADFAEIAKSGGFGIAAEDAEKILGEHLFNIWERYVRKSASEREEGMIAEYAARIGGKVCAASVVNRAQRLVRMFELGAPEIIVLDEERNFAEALALNICANEVE